MKHPGTIRSLTFAIAAALTALGLTQAVSAQDAAEPFRFYQHPGTHEYRQAAQEQTPSLAAAHTISLSSELQAQYTDAEREQIHTYGPWLTHDGISHNAQVLIRAIQEARVHGLSPNAYQGSKILLTVDLLNHLDEPQLGLSEEQRKEDAKILRLQLDDLLNSAFVKLVEHLGQGVVDIPQLQKRFYHERQKINAFNLLVSVSSADISVEQVLQAATPSHPAYHRLKNTMRDLLTEHATRIERTRVAKSNEAKLIAVAEDKQLIRERLLETGYMTFEAYAARNPDAELVKSLRVFQTSNGLQASSFADEKTRTALNASVEDDIQSVALSLERWRWLPREFGARHIFVNIPDYTVKLIDNGETQLSMPVVVGKSEHQTPSFSRNMTYMDFNPTWTVPAKIANKELIPRERRKPGYLKSRQFDFLKKISNRLVKVPENTVTRDDFNAARFPYTLQQRGGPINALGRMKFMMPNKYAIYLHDTPAKKHFTLNDRAHSHGCIRLSDPDSLARQLMRDDGYPQSEIDASFKANGTHRVWFRQPIPTHLVYLTAWVDEDNHLQKRPDIYRNDDALLQALRASGTLMSDLLNTTATLNTISGTRYTESFID